MNSTQPYRDEVLNDEIAVGKVTSIELDERHLALRGGMLHLVVHILRQDVRYGLFCNSQAARSRHLVHRQRVPSQLPGKANMAASVNAGSRLIHWQ
jgi:hypothetical protein